MQQQSHKPFKKMVKKLYAKSRVLFSQPNTTEIRLTSYSVFKPMEYSFLFVTSFIIIFIFIHNTRIIFINY